MGYLIPAEEAIRIMDEAKAFAKANVFQGAYELHNLSTTSILPEGVVRQCARLISQLQVGNSLGIAEALFRSEAIEYLAKRAI